MIRLMLLLWAGLARLMASKPVVVRSVNLTASIMIILIQ